MPRAEQTVVRLQRIVALATIALVASTWRLWTPESGFPQVPWFARAGGIPPIVDWLALAGLLGSCLFLLVAAPTARLRSGVTWLYAGFLVTLLLPNQHRLQPWAYEFLLLAIVLGLATPARAVPLLRWLVAGIYVHSALSKIDVAFFDAQGEMLLDGLLRAVHVSDQFWSARARLLAIGLFPAGELVIGIGLLVPSVRSPALAGSCVMHALLLLTLGPWGLDHRPGVLIWNVFFIAQNWMLFRSGPPPDESLADTLPVTIRARNGFATVIVVVVTLAPFLQTRGWYDVWPSWAVYSSRPSQVTCLVASDRVGDLPASLQEFVGPPEPLKTWRPVNLDAWSYEELNCPLYPEERFRIAVIRALTDPVEPDGVRVVVQGPPNRWTGRRQSTEISGSRELGEFCNRYWLNTLTRGR